MSLTNKTIRIAITTAMSLLGFASLASAETPRRTDAENLCLLRGYEASRKTENFLNEFQIEDLIAHINSLEFKNLRQALNETMKLEKVNRDAFEDALGIVLEKIEAHLSKVTFRRPGVARELAFETILVQYENKKSTQGMETRYLGIKIVRPMGQGLALLLGVLEIPFNTRDFRLSDVPKALHWAPQGKGFDEQDMPYIVEAMYDSKGTSQFCTEHQRAFPLSIEIRDANDARVRQGLIREIKSMSKDDVQKALLFERTLESQAEAPKISL